MIFLKDINIIFGKGTADENHVLHDVDLTVKEGDFITIIGSNGAGKSTLFNIISGHNYPSSGTIHIDGREITREPEFRRAAYIGRIFQNPLLGTAGTMSVEDNMMMASKKGFKGLRISLNRKKREEFVSRLEELEMQLEGRMSDNVQTMSGGQRQALTLLMTVLSRPRLLLLDEHTAALDPRNAAKVMELTRRFIEANRLTAMMVTHNMGQAIEYGNRLLMMDAGEIILDISGDEKKALTVDSLIQRFHDIRRNEFQNDKTLLS